MNTTHSDLGFTPGSLRSGQRRRGVGGGLEARANSVTTVASSNFVKLKIQKALKDLPALPEVVNRVLKETENPDCSAATVERMLLSDQALTSKVLRVVNSAYYGLSGQVSNLGQAIVILGVQQIRNLVLSVGAINVFEAKTPRAQEMLRLFWLHSFGTAAAAHLLAQDRRMPGDEQEAMFVAAIMHDLGKLFLFANFTELYDDVTKYSRKHDCPILAAEKKMLGLTHCQVGEEMTRRWLLPAPLVELIAQHEGPFTGGESDAVYCVHVGDAVTVHLYHPEEEPPRPIVIDPKAAEWLGRSDEELAELVSETSGCVEEAARSFGLMAA